ncbi:hypothetical protein RB600_000583 [Gaeumannomyces tritici]
MRRQTCLSAAAALLLGAAHAKKPCPFWGHMYPKPETMVDQPEVRAIAGTLDALFSQRVDSSAELGAANFSYTVEVFSTRDERPLWSRYRTASRLPVQDVAGVGVRAVGPDTVFRIGSVTKVFTVLAFLAAVGDGVWNDPVTKFIPELAALVAGRGGVQRESTWSVDWDDITIGSLAGQTSGLIRDYSLLSELTWQNAIRPELLVYFGFPPLNRSEIPPCGSLPTCSRERMLRRTICAPDGIMRTDHTPVRTPELFAGFARQPPSFPPSATPAYSDVGYVLLAWALENITGKKYGDIIRQYIIEPLGLTGTYTSPPPESVGVIPGEKHSTGWTLDMNQEVSTGGMWSSTRDLTKLGQAIMGSKLIKPSMTRRWLKPATFSSDNRASVGEPWGVRQIPLVGTNSSYQFVTSFNKAGQIGKYGVFLALIPELDLGFSVLTAGEVPANLNIGMTETLAGAFLPTWLAASRRVANETYGGRYRSAALNSTILVTAGDDNHPGLAMREWTSNGTDMFPIALSAAVYLNPLAIPGVQISIRLYPTGLEDRLPGGGGRRRVAFKAMFEDLSQPEVSSMYLSDCATWVAQSGAMWGSLPLDQFVFELDGVVGAGGRARRVRNAALRADLDWVALRETAAGGT